MIENTHSNNNTLLIISLLYGVFGNAITDIDLILSVITKCISVITFIIFIIVNHQTIIEKSREFLKFIKLRK